MKAAITDRYGPPEVAVLRETPMPAPGEGDVLVKVHATTVNRTDCGMRTPYPFFARAFTGLLKPKIQILGLDFAGVVLRVGANVTDLILARRATETEITSCSMRVNSTIIMMSDSQ